MYQAANPFDSLPYMDGSKARSAPGTSNNPFDSLPYADGDVPALTGAITKKGTVRGNPKLPKGEIKPFDALGANVSLRAEYGGLGEGLKQSQAATSQFIQGRKAADMDAWRNANDNPNGPAAMRALLGFPVDTGPTILLPKDRKDTELGKRVPSRQQEEDAQVVAARMATPPGATPYGQFSDAPDGLTIKEAVSTVIEQWRQIGGDLGLKLSHLLNRAGIVTDFGQFAAAGKAAGTLVSGVGTFPALIAGSSPEELMQLPAQIVESFDPRTVDWNDTEQVLLYLANIGLTATGAKFIKGAAKLHLNARAKVLKSFEKAGQTLTPEHVAAIEKAMSTPEMLSAQPLEPPVPVSAAPPRAPEPSPLPPEPATPPAIAPADKPTYSLTMDENDKFRPVDAQGRMGPEFDNPIEAQDYISGNPSEADFLPKAKPTGTSVPPVQPSTAPPRNPAGVYTANEQLGVSPQGFPIYARRVNPADIGVHPIMQHKGSSSGIDDFVNMIDRAKVVGIKTFDQAAPDMTAWMDKDSRLWAMNGHHRRFIGINTNTPDIGIKYFKEIDGVTIRQARGLGAIQNILDNQGSSLDAAAAARDLDITIDALENYGVNIKKGMGREIKGLNALSDPAFDFVRQQRVHEKVAVAIGDANLPADRQLAAMKDAERVHLKTYAEGAQLAERARHGKMRAPAQGAQGKIIFEGEDGEVLHLAEESMIAAGLESRLNQNRTLLRRYLKGRPVEGTTINKQGQLDAAFVQEIAKQVINSDHDVATTIAAEADKYAANPTPTQLSRAIDTIEPIAERAAERRIDELGFRRSRGASAENPVVASREGPNGSDVANPEIGAGRQPEVPAAPRVVPTEPDFQLTSPEPVGGVVQRAEPAPVPDVANVASVSPVDVPRDMSEVLARAGIFVKQDTVNGKTVWRVSGRTFDIKDLLKEKFNARWYAPGNSWTIWGDNNPADALARAIDGGTGSDVRAGAAGAVDSGGATKEPGARGRNDGGDAERISGLRRWLDATPDTRPTSDLALREVGQTTRALISAGIKHGIPERVIANQIEDVGRAIYAYENGKKVFLITNEPGTGKTFMLGGIIRELAQRGEMDVTYVTQSQDLIAQIKNDLKSYGIDHVKFRTYSDMSTHGAGGDRGGILLFDETHNAKNLDAKAGAAAKKMIADAKMTVMASATPYEDPTQAAFLGATGIFDNIDNPKGWAIDLDAHGQWSRAYGAGTQFVGKDKYGDPTYILKWPSGNTESAHSARSWLEREGVLSYRKMELDPSMVESEHVRVQAPDEYKNIYDRVLQAYDDAMGDAEDGGGRKSGIIAAHQINTVKRILEAAKVHSGIDQAKQWLGKVDENGNPYNVVLFVETKSDRSIGKFRQSGDARGKLYDYPEMQEMMDAWEASKMPGERPDPPPFHPDIVKIAAAMHDNKVRYELPSVEQEIVQALGGKDKVGVYTGNATQSAASADKVAFLAGKKRVLVATMAKGGTGLSLHDTVGNRPTVQLNINLPWSATKVDQVAGRVARYGLKSKALIRWLFAPNLGIENALATRVGNRMLDLGASVKGIDSVAGASMKDLDTLSASRSVKQLQDAEALPLRSRTADDFQLTAPEPARAPTQESLVDVPQDIGIGSLD